MTTADAAPRRPGRPATLTREQVVATALEIAHGKGLEAVSLRTVSEALGVHQTSLYTYVGSKEGLLRAMLDEVFTAHLALPAEDDKREPAEQLKEIFRELRRVGADNCELLALVGGSVGTDAGPRAALDCVMRLLARLGLEAEEQVTVFHLLYQLTVASGLITGNRRRAEYVDDPQPQDLAAYPHLQHVLDAVGELPDPDTQFERELTLVFDVTIPSLLTFS
jgi:AcrR family transcriptional regulator